MIMWLAQTSTQIDQGMNGMQFFGGLAGIIVTIIGGFGAILGTMIYRKPDPNTTTSITTTTSSPPPNNGEERLISYRMGEMEKRQTEHERKSEDFRDFATERLNTIANQLHNHLSIQASGAD